MLKHVFWRETAWAIGFVALMSLLYVGSYYAMVHAVSPARAICSGGIRDLSAGTRILPKTGDRVIFELEYRFGGKTAQAIFGPAYLLELQNRPKAWVYTY